jgi:DNA invertase Pin-like site-specific DNA recombinase
MRQVTTDALGQASERHIGVSEMIVGYARTSTLDQQAGFDAQLRDLTGAGCERVFQEQVSSVATRPQLEAGLDFVRVGDVFIVTKLDRLARSISHLLQIVERLRAKGVTLRILSGGEAMDTSTATGRLMLSILGSIAEFERAMMLERQREGIAKAKVDGKYKGRAPTARAKAADVHRLAAEGVNVAEIARRLGMHRASAHRILAAAA